MFSRRFLLTLLAGLIALAHLHCVLEYKLPALSYCLTSSHGPVFPLPKKHCDNEPSCICKGATLVRSTSVELATPTVAPHFAMCARLVIESRPWGLSGADSFAQHSGFSLSGKILRTQLSSLVI
jgi:hypothetical protein